MDLVPLRTVFLVRVTILSSETTFGPASLIQTFLVKYLSPATSTFILRVSRAHYRIVWAALSFMTSVPIKNGKGCIFRVVRVSGTIRLAQDEAIRRAREFILKAKSAQGDKSDSVLEGILGNGKAQAGATTDRDIMEVDRSDSEEDVEMSDRDG